MTALDLLESIISIAEQLTQEQDEDLDEYRGELARVEQGIRSVAESLGMEVEG